MPGNRRDLPPCSFQDTQLATPERQPQWISAKDSIGGERTVSPLRAPGLVTCRTNRNLGSTESGNMQLRKFSKSSAHVPQISPCGMLLAIPTDPLWDDAPISAAKNGVLVMERKHAMAAAAKLTLGLLRGPCCMPAVSVAWCPTLPADPGKIEDLIFSGSTTIFFGMRGEERFTSPDLGRCSCFLWGDPHSSNRPSDSLRRPQQYQQHRQ